MEPLAGTNRTRRHREAPRSLPGRPAHDTEMRDQTIMTINPDPGLTTAAAPEPELQEYELLDRDDRPFEIYGRLLGFSSSRREDHEHDPYFTERSEMRHERETLR